MNSLRKKQKDLFRIWRFIHEFSGCCYGSSSGDVTNVYKRRGYQYRGVVWRPMGGVDIQMDSRDPRGGERVVTCVVEVGGGRLMWYITGVVSKGSVSKLNS